MKKEIAEAFDNIANDEELSKDEKVEAVVKYDFAQFGQHEPFAREKAQVVISELRIKKGSKV